LSNIQGEGRAVVITHHDGSKRLKVPDPLLFTIFKDGFVLGTDGPLRSYTSELSQAFINDVIDGYFPYELKTQYPDGSIRNTCT
jgi:hypothetical protein